LAHPRAGCQAATPPPLSPKKAKLKKHRFCRHDDINVLRDLPFSLNQYLKSADDYCIGILKNVTKPHKYVDIICLSVSFNFACNLTRSALGDFVVIFITQFLKTNIIYIYIYSLKVSPQRKILGAPMCYYYYYYLP
jgi:hypothetical protein